MWYVSYFVCPPTILTSPPSNKRILSYPIPFNQPPTSPALLFLCIYTITNHFGSLPLLLLLLSTQTQTLSSSSFLSPPPETVRNGPDGLLFFFFLGGGFRLRAKVGYGGVVCWVSCGKGGGFVREREWGKLSCRNCEGSASTGNYVLKGLREREGDECNKEKRREEEAHTAIIPVAGSKESPQSLNAGGTTEPEYFCFCFLFCGLWVGGRLWRESRKTNEVWFFFLFFSLGGVGYSPSGSGSLEWGLAGSCIL